MVLCCLEVLRLRPRVKIRQYPRDPTSYISVTQHSSEDTFLKSFENVYRQITKRQLEAQGVYSSFAHCWTNFESCLDFLAVFQDVLIFISQLLRGNPYDVRQRHGWETLPYIVSYLGKR
jgi:hypothetical protein